MNDRKYYIVVRLFKDWESRIIIYGGCVATYKSMRVELNTMDYGDESNWQFLKWRLLHQGIQLDTLYGTPNITEELIKNMYDNLPFDILIKTSLTRLEALELEGKLHTAIYPDIISEDEISEDNLEPTYKNWMAGYKNALAEFDKIIDLPSKEYDKFNPELSI